MKANEANIFIFIASIIVGILISSNMNFSKINNKILLTPAEYQEAHNYNNKLNTDISNLQSEYSKYKKKLKKYQEKENNKDQLLSEIENEINENEIALGKKDVEGQGIMLTLDDASNEQQNAIVNPNDWWNRLVHDSDIRNVLNELKIAGAEAISINGQRVVEKSSILCWGVFTELDGVKLPAPFNFKVIGDKDKLYSYMAGDGGYISFLKIRGIKVNIEKSDNIKILSYDKKVDYKYMKESKGK